MRKDMDKVLSDRPRCGGYGGYHHFRRAENRGDPEMLPKQQGMRRPYHKGWGEGMKDDTTHHTPMHRYLRANIGRRWDDVWSDICSAAPTGVARETARREIDLSRRWVFRGFPVSGFDIDSEGKLTYTPRTPLGRYAPVVRVDGICYRQDAETGIYDPLRPTGNGPPYPFKIIGDREAVWVGGVWYWVLYDTIKIPAFAKSVREFGRQDIVTGATIFGAGNSYRAGKQQMSSADLRRNKLVNAVLLSSSPEVW